MKTNSSLKHLKLIEVNNQIKVITVFICAAHLMHHPAIVKAFDKLFQVYFTKLTEGQDRAYPEPTAQGSQ